MNSSESTPLPPPPGVIGALKAGLDVISNHLSVLILPMALDALLWFGPRLSVKNIFLQAYSQALEFYTRYNLLNDAQLEQMRVVQQNLPTALQRFNLLGFLRTFPVGVSSLMQAKMPISTPFGQPLVIEAGSWVGVFGWVFLFLLLGWILGSLYFGRVSNLVGHPETTTHALHVMLHTLLFCIGFSGLILIIGLPVLFVLAILNEINTFVMQTAFFVLAMLGSWLIVPIFFAPYGIFLRGENVFRSIYSSLRMARFILPSASMFVLVIFLVGQGLNILWAVPPDNSWMLLVGVIGHAFITTALLAASFIYYRDMNTWLEIVLQRMKAAAPRQAL